jgi:hypothetical protein
MHISNQAVAKMRLAKPIAVAAILVGSFGAAGAATVCVDPGNPGACASTIQAGIDAAVAGDTVVLNKGTYYENVQVPAGKDGLTIQAQGKNPKGFVLDAGLPNAGAALSIASAGVTVQGLTLRNGSSAGIVFEPGADGGAVSKVTIQAFSQGCLVATGDSYSITESTFTFCGSHDGWEGYAGVYLGGDDASVTDSTFSHHQSSALIIEGTNGIASRNTFSLVDYRAIAFPAEGNTATANDNRVTDSDTGISSNGAQLTALRNRGERLNDEIVRLSNYGSPCSGATLIADNYIDGATNDSGITVICDEDVDPGTSIIVEDNVVKNAERAGMEVRADGAVVRNNKVLDSGFNIDGGDAYTAGDFCYYIEGAGAVGVGNFAARCGTGGFGVAGDAAELRDNTALKTGGTGFVIIDGDAVVLTGNKSERNLQFGFAVDQSATAAVLSENRAKKNREDLCDSGTGTVLSGNKFATSIDPPATYSCYWNESVNFGS